MFKIGVVRTLLKPGDEQVFMPAIANKFVRSFPGLLETDKVPVPRTVWNFRELPAGGGLVDGLHGILDNCISTHGFPPSNKTMADSTFIESPGRHNTRKENKTVKKGEV